MYKPGVRYSAIAQALAGFTSDVDSCLLDYIVSQKYMQFDWKVIGIPLAAHATGRRPNSARNKDSGDGRGQARYTMCSGV